MWDKSEVPGGWIYSCRGENGGMVAVFVPGPVEDRTVEWTAKMQEWLQAMLTARNAEIRAMLDADAVQRQEWVDKSNAAITARFKVYDNAFTDALTQLGFKPLGKRDEPPPGAAN